jgi:hypothetical protein
LWDGQSWTVESSNSSAFVTAFTAVSCFAEEQCIVTGYTQSAPGPTTAALAELFANGVWSDVTPTTRALSNLGPLACGALTPSTTCTVLGQATTGIPYTEQWNSSTQSWTDTEGSALFEEPAESLSCLSATWCVAVGRFVGVNGSFRPVANAWNGTGWSLMDTDHLGQTSTDPVYPFTSVSCPSLTFCVAVGQRQALTGQQPEAASWGTP